MILLGIIKNKTKFQIICNTNEHASTAKQRSPLGPKNIVDKRSEATYIIKVSYRTLKWWFILDRWSLLTARIYSARGKMG
jgi:hypothetical protein